MPMAALQQRSIAITEPPHLISSINAVTQVLCYGGNNGNATVTASGEQCLIYTNGRPSVHRGASERLSQGIIPC